MHRAVILDKAKDTIIGERQDQYGNPEDSFKTIATYWNTYLKGRKDDLTPKDVCLMMALLKVAREQNQGKLDNLVDAIGYMAIASEVGESPAPAKKGIFSK